MNDFNQNGYVILPQAIDIKSIDLLKQEISRYTKDKMAYGIRDLHSKISSVYNLATSDVIKNILDEHKTELEFKLIKAIFFNKNLQQNWAVPWHQDKTIAVKQKVAISGYKNWTVKQGVTHVQPPLNILNKITTIRIALDDTDSNNGALKIIPRSHKLGVLNQKQLNCVVQQESALSCSLKTGDILMMHPLILHSSNKSINNKARRTIHLEYSNVSLPQNLAWS